MTTLSNTSQLTIQLEIQPRVSTDIALAREIGEEICTLLEEQGYNIEPHDTGEMGGWPILDILHQFIIHHPFIRDVVLNVVKDSVTELFKQIRSSRIWHKEPFCASIQINLPDGREIKVPEGPIADAVEKIVANLENLKEQQVDINHDQQVTETPKTVAILITVGKYDSHL